MRHVATILAAALATAALCLAGSAAAAYTSPRLAVAVSGAGLRIGFAVANTDDPTGRLAIYVPVGYTVGAPPAGAKLGPVTATAAAADLAGAILPLTGDLDAVDPNTLSAPQRSWITLCLGGLTASQTWLLHLTGAGQIVDVPVLVVPAVASETAAGYAAKLVVCPPSGALAGRAPYGAKLLSATFAVSAIAPPAAAGDTRWTATFTPYAPGVGALNPPGTIETQSIVRSPTRILLRYAKKRVVTFTRVKGKRVRTVGTQVNYSTRMSEAGRRVGGTVVAAADGKRVGGARGSFIFTGTAVRLTAAGDLHKRTPIPTGASASNADLFYGDLGASACTKTPMFGGIPCVAATIGRATPRTSLRIAGFTK